MRERRGLFGAVFSRELEARGSPRQGVEVDEEEERKKEGVEKERRRLKERKERRREGALSPHRQLAFALDEVEEKKKIKPIASSRIASSFAAFLDHFSAAMESTIAFFSYYAFKGDNRGADGKQQAAIPTDSACYRRRCRRRPRLMRRPSFSIPSLPIPTSFKTYVVVEEPDPVHGSVGIGPLRGIPVDGLVDQGAPEAAETVGRAGEVFESVGSTANLEEESDGE